MGGLVGEGVPALGGEGEGVAGAGDQAQVGGLLLLSSSTTLSSDIDRGILGGGDVADDIDVVEGDELLVVVDVAGEEEFVILAAVESASDDIEVHLVGKCYRLVIDGEFVLVDVAADLGLRAYMEEFGRESVGDIHHGRGFDARLAQLLDDIDACLGFELALKEVFTTLELLVDGIVVLVGFAEIVVAGGTEDLQLALQELESEIRRAEVACDADEVVGFGTVAVDDILFVGYAEAGDGNGQTVHRGAGVTADEVDMIMFAREARAYVELLQILNRETRGYTQTDGDLRGGSVHGADIRNVDRHGFVTQMAQGHVLKVEMDTLDQEVGGDEGTFATMVEHRRVVAYGIDSGWLAGFQVAREVTDKTELTEFGDGCHVIYNLTIYNLQFWMQRYNKFLIFAKKEAKIFGNLKKFS